MRKRFATGFLGSLALAVSIVACQPVFDPGAGTVGRGSTPDRVAGAPVVHLPAAPPSTTTTTTTSHTTTEPLVDLRPESPGGDIEHGWHGTGPKVAVLGDSLTVQARAHLREMAAGAYALKVGALYGEGISGGALSVNLSGPIMPAVIDEYAEDPPDVVVLALGTNDVWRQDLGLASFEREWHHATRAFPAACLVGVTVTETGGAWLYDTAEARRVNRVIRRTVDVVADWSNEGSSDRYTAEDDIHLTDAGRAHFAALVMAGVDQCTSS